VTKVLDHPEQVRAALQGWIAERLPADEPAAVHGVEVSELASPGAGQSSEMVLFTVRWCEGRSDRTRDYVLRCQPGANRIFLDADVGREARVLQALGRGSGVPVPPVLGAEPDPAILGVPFFVMARVAGTVPQGKPSIHTVGWLPTLTADQRARLWRGALDTLVAVHRVEWRRAHGFLLGPEGVEPDLAGHVERLARWYRWVTGGRAFPVTDAALEHLVATAPTVRAGEPVLVWGDARVGNMIFGDDLSVAAAIDWELATIGPPGLDLGHWLFFDELLTDASGVARLAGFPDRATTIARHRERSGRSVDDIAWFETLAALFTATTVIRQADIGVEQGRLAPDTRLGHDNAITRVLARELGLPPPDLSRDWLAHRNPIPTRARRAVWT
jgi:aminoglycoside phosphotransferase (APT) family kinase protein